MTVQGENVFLLDPIVGLEAPLIEDPFNHLNLDGTPFMWGLLGDWQMALADGHGKVLKGTAGSSIGFTEAFRGDPGWINKPGESSYMNYFVQADVKLLSATAAAGLCLRVAYDEAGHGDRFYELHLNGVQSELQLRRRVWVEGMPGHWDWERLGSWGLSNPTGWHTIAVEAVNSPTPPYLTFKCYLDGVQHTVTRDWGYPDGLVGLWVESGAALFDNVKVLDLRQ